MDHSEREFLEKFSSELETELKEGILPYWIENTIDYKRGGFYGRITFDNIPVKDAEKGSVVTARILWTFSAAYKKFRNPDYKMVADHAFKYLTETLWDHKYKGVFWMVDADENPTESRKHVYAQAFAIYALSECYSAFETEAALNMAKELYHQIEANCADTENGGYFEAFNQQWELLDDVRLSEKDRNEPKSMNTHLHLLEAYTNLYRYWKSPGLKEKLSTLIDIFANYIIREGRTLVTFLGKDWMPKSNEISFGHNIETSWLLLEAAEALEDYPDYISLKEISLQLAGQVKKVGMDEEHGGIYNEAGPEGIIDDNKDWWPQAEAIVGFINAYQLTNDIQYLHASYAVWDFTKKRFIDHKHGEWHEKVTRSGVPFRLDKVRSWKCPYHNSRMVLEIMYRTEALLNAAISEKKNTSGVIS